MSEKQGLVLKDKKEKDWDVDKIFDRVKEASLKDPVVASYVADLNKRARSQQDQSATQASTKWKHQGAKAKK